VLEGRLAGWAWPDVQDALARERDWLARFVAEQGVQTNEVQRCWALLPAFLSLGERPLELVELGASAGLNLLWDRYRYRYRAGEWGPPGLELCGEERRPVSAAVLARRADVRCRRGIDLEPIDVRDPTSVRLLECFVWPDQPERMERLRRAVERARQDPPEVIRGDYVDVLPSLLDDRRRDALTVVFQTVSTVYLSEERYAELRRIVDNADVAWISTRRFTEETTTVEGGFELELRAPGEREPRLVAALGYHGQWLDWTGP
jgi:hypothetical protein